MRERLTWQNNGRKASAPPATPGYGTADQDHPAHKNDPDMHEYENGDTSSWKEDPKMGPYPQGNPPSTPGYDTEDQDHPAHKELPRVPKEARMAAMRKAAKCARIVEACGCGDEDEMENQALTLMDLPETQLDTTIDTLDRIGGGFMAADEDLDDILEEGGDKVALEDVMEKLAEITKELEGLKAARKFADQNDPKGPTLAPKPKTEEEAREESEDPIVAEFDKYDTSKVGFLYKNEWKGSKAVFASLDSDRDGIVARADLIKMAAEDEEEEELEEEDGVEKTAAEEDELELEDEGETASKKAAAEEEEETEEEDGVEKTAAEDEELKNDPMQMSDEDDTDEEEKKVLASLFKRAGDEEDEEEDEGEMAAKKAAEEENELFKTPKKEANLRPQPRKPNPGLKSVGNLSRVASKAADKDLESLWKSDPLINKLLG